MGPGGTCRGLVAAVALLAAQLIAAPAAAERYAVVAVDTANDGAAPALSAARAARERLRASGADVLDEEATRAPLREHLSRGGAPLSTYQGRLAQSEAALAALEQDKAVQILETLVTDLVSDQEPTVEKLQLLEQARLRLATRLIGLGGKRETGRSETPEGKRAHKLLVDALRTHPTLAPSKDEYPARFFTLLDGARTALDAQGRGGLHVDSRPRGATVLLDGRDVGRTPLVLGPDALSLGEYRLWVSIGAARSVPMRVLVEPEAKPLLVDLAFDGALWPEGPGLRPVEGASIDEDVAKTVGGVLGADVLLLIGVSEGAGGDAPSLWGAAFTVARAQAARRGAVPLVAGVAVEDATAELVRYLAGDDGGDARARELQRTVLPQKDQASGAVGAAEVAGEFPWVAVGVIGGGVAAALLVGGAVVAAVALTPETGAYTVTITDIGGVE
mgnify:CR=1 FL=1